MLICLPVYASLFFLPAYLIMSSFPGPFESFTYLLFVLIWAGYGLFSGGMMLHLELGYRGRTAFALYNLWFVVLALIFVSFVFGLGQSVVFGTADLARAYGPLPAALGFLAGALAFGALGSATVRRLRRRELA